jgi:hypothetical protein
MAARLGASNEDFLAAGSTFGVPAGPAPLGQRRFGLLFGLFRLVGLDVLLVCGQVSMHCQSGSLGQPDVADRVRWHRRSDLESRTGRIMMLWKCAEFLAWAGAEEPEFGAVRRAAEELVQ